MKIIKYLYCHIYKQTFVQFDQICQDFSFFPPADDFYVSLSSTLFLFIHSTSNTRNLIGRSCKIVYVFHRKLSMGDDPF